MDAQIEEIKKRIDIVEFIGSFIEVKKTGRNFKACCPFHNEKTPSFVISPDRQIWHCFGSCGEGGDIITFLMKWESVTFFEALRDLAEKAGVKLESVNFEDKEWSIKEKILKINHLTAEYYQYLLQETSFGAHARDYLQGRGINLQIAKKFTLGYSPQSWDSLLKFLKKKGFSEYDQLQAGVLVKNDKGNMYDRFRGRLMFPIRDTKGQVIGFSGRLLDVKEATAKYVNTPETAVYHKRESLFGIHLAKDAIRKEENVLLVEGEFDMITPYMFGIEHVVAIKGSAVTKEQLTTLKRFTQKITLALDSDNAGEEAVKRGIAEAEKQEFEINVVQFSKGKDPDEAARNDLITFKKEVQTPAPLYDFLIHLAQQKYPGEAPFNKKKIADELLPFLGNIQNPIVLSHYVRVLSHLLSVSEDSIQHALKKKKRKTYQSARTFVKPKQEGYSREEMMQRYLLGSILQKEKPYEDMNEFFTEMQPHHFTIPALAKIAAALQEYKKTHEQFNLQSFFQSLPAELVSVADEVYLYSSNSQEMAQQDIHKMVYEIKRSGIKSKITHLLSKSDEDPERDKTISTLQVQLNELNKSQESK